MYNGDGMALGVYFECFVVREVAQMVYFNARTSLLSLSHHKHIISSKGEMRRGCGRN